MKHIRTHIHSRVLTSYMHKYINYVQHTDIHKHGESNLGFYWAAEAGRDHIPPLEGGFSYKILI